MEQPRRVLAESGIWGVNEQSQEDEIFLPLDFHKH